MSNYEAEMMGFVEVRKLSAALGLERQRVAELQAEKERLRRALLTVMREWNRDVEYATAPTREWKQAEDALGQKVAPRDLKTLLLSR